MLSGKHGAMEMSKTASIAGLALSLVGVLLLFRYGMPYMIETKGEVGVILEGVDQKAIETEKRYRYFGKIGLALVVIGTLLQAWGAYSA